MKNIELIEKQNFKDVLWPETEWGKKVSIYFHPLMEQGVKKLIPNITTQLQIIKKGDFVLPISVNQKEYSNSYVVSNYYAFYLLREKLSKEKPKLFRFLSPLLLPLSGILKFLKINKVVHLNTWFFSASIPPSVTSEQLSDIKNFLVKKYPDHLLMFRSVTDYFDKELYQALKDAGFMLVPSRKIYFYNPFKESFSKKAKYHRRKDLRLLEASGYTIISNNSEYREEDIYRIVELYKKIYIDKYTPYSPDFSFEFVSHLIRNDLMQFIALKKNGRIDAVFGYQKNHQMMQVPFMGYEGSLPKELGLYRIISLLAYLEADRLGLYYHDGHGADSFKSYRGLEKATEYTAIYFGHFRNLRRLPWTIAERFLKAH